MKYLYFDNYRGGLTNIKIKIVYAKIIADALNRELIFVENKLHSKLYKYSPNNISHYFHLNDLGKVVDKKLVDFNEIPEDLASAFLDKLTI